MNITLDAYDFANYVKEKTGIEPEIRLSPESGEPCVYFGPEFEKTFEHCCDKKEEKKASNHEFSDAIAEAALEICGIDLKKGVKND